MNELIVVKIGGSILRTSMLPQVLNLIIRRERPLILVPGGGLFADSIRNLQNTLKFPDSTAHRMALLAMHQFAFLILDYSKIFKSVETIFDFKRVINLGYIPVWLPERMVVLAKDVPQKWTMTSDGLSAWLALQLGGAEVCLLKSCPISMDTKLYELLNYGIVDPEFCTLVEKGGLKWSAIEILNDKEILKRISMKT